MKNRNEILDIYLQQFASYKSVQLLINPSFLFFRKKDMLSLEIMIMITSGTISY